MLQRVSLRARLLAITLLLVTVALAAAGWATHRALRSFLVDRVDQELMDARRPALMGLLHADGYGPGPRPGPGLAAAELPVGAVAQLRTDGGRVIERTEVRRYGDARPALEVPDTIAPGVSEAEVGGAGRYRFLSVAASGAGRAGPDAAIASGTTLVIGVPLSGVEDTLGRLVLIELAVGGATLIVLAAVALWLTRLGLRPLERIGVTADAIAAGDLSRRVEDDDPRTEIGRLGRTLNAMLTRIEESFAERRATEARLRRFVGDASHELQTPLTSVRGYAELFRRGAADRPEDLERAMRRIESEAARMGVLVDDLLLLARLDQGRPLARERIDLAALGADAVADARVVEPGRPLELQAEGPVWVEGDDARLRQVVGNLLANVRAHTPPAAPATVRVRREGDEAVLAVSDTGPGMTPDDAARVFERFFRADPSRARTSGGSGLGLAIVAAICEAHGGRAEVTASPGAGATFRAVLPAAH